LVDRFGDLLETACPSLKGPAIRRSRSSASSDGLVETATALSKRLEELEPAHARSHATDRAELANLRRRFSGCTSRSRVAPKRIAAVRQHDPGSERQRHEDIYTPQLQLLRRRAGSGHSAVPSAATADPQEPAAGHQGSRRRAGAESERDSEAGPAIESISEGFIILRPEAPASRYLNERYKELHADRRG